MGVVYASFEASSPRRVAADLAALGQPTDRFYGKANSFRLPLGTDAGRGWVLLPYSSVQQLDFLTPADLTFSATDAAAATPYSVTLKNLLAVGREAVHPGRADDPNAPYVVELRDRRLLYTKYCVQKGYNIRNPADGTYYAATQNAGVSWTWDALGADLWAAVGGQLGTWPGLPFTPDGTPDNWEFWSDYAWESLGKFLRRLGCDLRLDPFADTLTIIRLNASDPTADAAAVTYSTAPTNLRIDDGYFAAGARALIPASARVRFCVLPLVKGITPFYSVDVADPTGNGTGLGIDPNTFVILDDDLAAVYSGVTLTNSAALASRAAERAADYFRQAWGDLAPKRIYYAAPLSAAGLLPGAATDATTWLDLGYERGRFAGMLTGVERRPDWRPARWEPETLRFLNPGSSTPAASFVGARCPIASTNFTSGVATSVLWSNPLPAANGQYDTSGFWASGHPTRLTCPSAGYYLFTAGVRWGSGSLGTRRSLEMVSTGATTITSWQDQHPATGGSYLSGQVSALEGQFGAGDYVEVIGIQDGGFTDTVTEGWFAVHKIG